MPDPTAKSRSWNERLMERVCDHLPNCTKALALVETGIRRDLSTRERVALKYHGRLCPFCACATGKFEAGMARMREAESGRRQ